MRLRIFTLFAFLVLASSLNFTSAAFVVPASSTSTEPDPATVKSAIAGYNSLSKKEKKAKIKEAKKELKAFKAAKKAGQEPSTNTLLLVILAILLPPLAVYLHEGEINTKFWISLLLTILFIIPGIIYALIVVLGKD